MANQHIGIGCSSLELAERLGAVKLSKPAGQALFHNRKPSFILLIGGATPLVWPVDIELLLEIGSKTRG